MVETVFKYLDLKDILNLYLSKIFPSHLFIRPLLPLFHKAIVGELFTLFKQQSNLCILCHPYIIDHHFYFSLDTCKLKIINTKIDDTVFFLYSNIFLFIKKLLDHHVKHLYHCDTLFQWVLQCEKYNNQY
jgi:hypothetical protein